MLNRQCFSVLTYAQLLALTCAAFTSCYGTLEYQMRVYVWLVLQVPSTKLQDDSLGRAAMPGQIKVNRQLAAHAADQQIYGLHVNAPCHRLIGHVVDCIIFSVA